MTKKERMQEEVERYIETYGRNIDNPQFESVMDNATFSLHTSINHILRPMALRERSPIENISRKLGATRNARDRWLNGAREEEEYAVKLSRDEHTAAEIVNITKLSLSHVKNLVKHLNRAHLADTQEMQRMFADCFIYDKLTVDVLAQRNQMSLYYAKRIIYVDQWEYILEKLGA